MYDIIPWLGGVKALLVLTVVIVGLTIGVWWVLTPSRVLRRAALATNKVQYELNVGNLSNELSAVTGWYLLGIRLGIPSHELGKIEQIYSSDVERRMKETLRLWLRYTPSATWKDVVIALQQMGRAYWLRGYTTSTLEEQVSDWNQSVSRVGNLSEVVPT